MASVDGLNHLKHPPTPHPPRPPAHPHTPPPPHPPRSAWSNVSAMQIVAPTDSAMSICPKALAAQSTGVCWSTRSCGFDSWGCAVRFSESAFFVFVFVFLLFSKNIYIYIYVLWHAKEF